MAGTIQTYWAALSFVFGAVIGSFLNVVIWRLPRGESLVSPGSHCPHCNRALKPAENIPLISFLALRARCQTCKQPISWRYFGVELLTGSVFLALYLKFGPTVETAAYCLFAAALIAALFTDLATFLIPDELNTVALFAGIGFDVWSLATGAPGHELLWGFLPKSIGGAVLCAGIFVAIQCMGLLVFRKDAMGDGDVKLARAIGAMLPIQQALVSFFLAIAVGALIGGVSLFVNARRAKPQDEELEDEDEPAEEQGGLGDTIVRGAIYLTFVDLALQLGRFLRIGPIARIADGFDPREPENEEDDSFVPGPTHIPFGPYMVLGALLAIFVGDRLVHWYLVWARIAPGS